MNYRMRKIGRSVVLGVVFLVIGIVSALAAGQVGTDPDSAMAPAPDGVAKKKPRRRRGKRGGRRRSKTSSDETSGQEAASSEPAESGESTS